MVFYVFQPQNVFVYEFYGTPIANVCNMFWNLVDTNIDSLLDFIRKYCTR